MAIDFPFHLLSVLLSAGFITYLRIFQLVLLVEVRRQRFVKADSEWKQLEAEHLQLRTKLGVQ